jgi:hypothetical protein
VAGSLENTLAMLLTLSMKPPLVADSISFRVTAELQPFEHKLSHEEVDGLGADTKDSSERLYLPVCGT